MGGILSKILQRIVKATEIFRRDSIWRVNFNCELYSTFWRYGLELSNGVLHIFE